MSFSLTTDQVRNKTKTVTRRLGWLFLKPGDILNVCVKCQGLKKGAKIEKICQIRVVDVRRERLSDIHSSAFSRTELAKEGFPGMTVIEFIRMFRAANKGSLHQWITRIEFEYV